VQHPAQPHETGSVAEKRPPSRKCFHDAGGLQKDPRVFQAEEDATMVVAPPSNPALRLVRAIGSSDM
jgi:hypothetical protein